jgi:hypothetical protein
MIPDHTFAILLHFKGDIPAVKYFNKKYEIITIPLYNTVHLIDC